MADRPFRQEIPYPAPTSTGHYGRNGTMQGHGISVEAWGGEAHLTGIVSSGRRSGAARISIPFSSIPQLIAALQKVS